MPRGLRLDGPHALREEMRADVWPPRTSLLPGVHQLPAGQLGLPSLYIIAEGAPARHITSQAHLEERLAALEEEMIRLRLRVAELEQHSSGAATG